jgi:tetratricopeptide (TPR) repeat protein
MSKRKGILSALFFLAFFGLYLKTLSPAYHPDDSPETITAAATLSIQHPPGYPLHSLLGRLAVLVFPGAAPFRVNLLSAMLGALGLLVMAHAAALAAGEVLGELSLSLGFSVAAVLGLSYTLWLQSSIAKGGIYGLNFLLTQICLWGLLQQRRAWNENQPSLSGLRLAALAFGLGMANHWTSQVVLMPGFAVLLAEPWWRRGKPGWKSNEWRAAATLAGLGLAGFSLYLVLPLRSLLHPVLQWGEPWTLSGFWWIFNRSQYAALEAHKSFSAFAALGLQVWNDLNLEFGGPGLAALAAAWAWLLWKKPWLGLALLSMPLALALAVCLKANPPSDSLWVIDPYLIPLYSGLSLGLLALPLPGEGAWAKFKQPILWAGALALLLWHFPMADQSQHFLGYDYVNNLFLSCPKNSLLYCEGDSNTAGPLCQRFVLGKRQDLALVADVLLDYDWYRQALQRFYPDLALPEQAMTPPGDMDVMAKLNAQRGRPILISNSYNKQWVAPESILPRGLVNRLIPKGPPSGAQILANRIWDAYELRGVFAPAVIQDPITQRLVTENYRDELALLAEALVRAGQEGKAEEDYARLGRLKPGWAAPWVQAGNMAYFKGAIDRAGSWWLRAVHEEASSAQAQSNLGLYYFAKKNFNEALACAEKAVALDPSLANAQDLLLKSRAAVSGQGATQPGSQGAIPGAGAQYAATGDALACKGDTLGALASYEHALAAGFVTAVLYRNLAVIFGRLNRNKEAEDSLQHAVSLEPKNAELHKYLGVYMFNNGKPKPALKELEESQRLNPSDSSLGPILAQVRAAQKP